MHTVMRKLRKAFPSKKNKHPSFKPANSGKSERSSKEMDEERSGNDDDSDNDFDAEEALRRNKQKRKKQIELPNINLDKCVYDDVLIFHFFSRMYI